MRFNPNSLRISYGINVYTSHVVETFVFARASYEAGQEDLDPPANVDHVNRRQGRSYEIP